MACAIFSVILFVVLATTLAYNPHMAHSSDESDMESHVDLVLDYSSEMDSSENSTTLDTLPPVKSGSKNETKTIQSPSGFQRLLKLLKFFTSVISGRSNGSIGTINSKRTSIDLLTSLVKDSNITTSLPFRTTTIGTSSENQAKTETESETKTTSQTKTESETTDKPWENFRLPSTIIPRLYKLTIYPKFNTSNAYQRQPLFGDVSILVEVTKDTNYIIIHVHSQITVAKATVTDVMSGDQFEILQQFNYPKFDYHVIETREVMYAGSHLEVSLRYYGYINTHQSGMYVVWLPKKDAPMRAIISTQFESIHARKAFPCFDEPHLKANFSVTIFHESHYTALSSMPPIRVITLPSVESNLVSTTFATTVVMSTYTLAMIITDYTAIETVTRKNVTIRVWASEERVNETAYALKVASDSLQYLEDLFESDYPLPKLDMVYVPGHNIMENWGLVVLNEIGVLYYEHHHLAKQTVAIIVCHEITHMWLGNLVTMKWWDDLWLNEGLTTYISYIALDAIDDGLNWVCW